MRRDHHLLALCQQLDAAVLALDRESEAALMDDLFLLRLEEDHQRIGSFAGAERQGAHLDAGPPGDKLPDAIAQHALGLTGFSLEGVEIQVERDDPAAAHPEPGARRLLRLLD